MWVRFRVAVRVNETILRSVLRFGLWPRVGARTRFVGLGWGEN